MGEVDTIQPLVIKGDWRPEKQIVMVRDDS